MNIFHPPIAPKCYTGITIPHGSGYGSGHGLDFSAVGEHGVAVFSQISNTSSTSIDVRLNGDTAATFTLAGNTTQVFNRFDMHITSMDFANTVSGAGVGTLDVIVGVA